MMFLHASRRCRCYRVQAPSESTPRPGLETELEAWASPVKLRMVKKMEVTAQAPRQQVCLNFPVSLPFSSFHIFDIPQSQWVSSTSFPTLASLVRYSVDVRRRHLALG